MLNAVLNTFKIHYLQRREKQDDKKEEKEEERRLSRLFNYKTRNIHAIYYLSLNIEITFVLNYFHFWCKTYKIKQESNWTILWIKVSTVSPK